MDISNIDNTGATDVTDELNLYIAAQLMSGAKEIELHGTYLCQYGLSIGSNGQDIAHPDLPKYAPSDFRIFGSAKILQTDNSVYRVKNADGTFTVLDKRKRWGVNLLKVRGAKDFSIEGLTFEGGNTKGQTSVYTDREDWIAFKLVGVENALFKVNIYDAWSDFVYFANFKDENNVFHPCLNVTFDESDMHTCGRQGFVINAIDGLQVVRSQVRNVKRLTIDAEPFNGGVVKNISFRENMLSAGNIGTVQLAVPGRIECENFEMIDNTILNRAMMVEIPNAKITEDGVVTNVQRTGLRLINNVCQNEDKPYAGRYAMIRVTGWDGVEVSGHSVYVDKLTRNLANLNRCPGAIMENNSLLLPTAGTLPV